MGERKEWVGRNGAKYTYDPALNIASIEFVKKPSRYWIDTVDEMHHHFEDVEEFWKNVCGGEKVYWLINYDHFEVNRNVIDQYVNDLRAIMMKSALAAVRYGGAFNQRTVSRFTNMKTHSPANIYESREEALQIIGELKSGARKLTP